MTKTLDCDVLVVGSGAGGLATAVAAAQFGKRVVVVEKAEHFGGTTAISGGWLWVPCSAQAIAVGVDDSLDKARRYLEGEMGQQFDAARVDAYLEAAPVAVDFFERHGELRFDLGLAYADYHPEAEGGMAGGRALVARPYDGRALGPEVRRLRPPVPEITFLGMMVGSGKELAHFFNVTRSLVSAVYVGWLLARYARDRLVHGRAMRLTNGSALVARLAKSAFDKGVDIRTATPVVRLTTSGGRVTGAVVREAEEEVTIEARDGVVLAAGGFAHDPEMRARLYPHVRRGGDHSSAVTPTATGDAIRMARAVGAEIVEDYPNAAAWVPLSLVPRKSGPPGPFPHFIDRAKPGVIAVAADGRRFVNEAVSYHDFVQALVDADPRDGPAACHLVTDHAAIRRYGLGHVKPFPMPLGPALKSGYLVRGDTIEALARAIGVPPGALAETVARYNAGARRGEDPEFGRGSTAYNRFLGDQTVAPNPCVGPLERGPFYAVRLVAGDLGTFAGIRTDAAARALDAAGVPVPGLYAVGNDAASVMGGTYPGAGITLGPALTFGYLAACAIAGRSAEIRSGGRPPT